MQEELLDRKGGVFLRCDGPREWTRRLSDTLQRWCELTDEERMCTLEDVSDERENQISILSYCQEAFADRMEEEREFARGRLHELVQMRLQASLANRRQS